MDSEVVSSSLVNILPFALAFLFIIIFIYLIKRFYDYEGDGGGKGFTKGEIRRSITFTFVMMYIVFLCLSLVPSGNAILDFGNGNEFINNFHSAILVILAFYFGSRAFEAGMEKKGKVSEIRELATNIFDVKNVDELPINELKERIKANIDSKDDGKLRLLAKYLNEIK